MPKMTHIIQEPTPNTRSRLKEIKFYLIINAIIGEGQTGMLKHDLLELLVKESGVKLDVIMRAANAILHRAYAPDKTELVIGCRHMGMSVLQTIATIETSNPTYYRLLETYIKDGEYELMPRLDKAYRGSIEIFTTAVSNLLNPFHSFLKWLPND